MKERPTLTEEEKHPLLWGEGWDRTRIQERKNNGGWKRPMRDYRAALVKELARMGVTEVMVSYNIAPSDRLDPGAAVYFSKSLKEDYSWQDGLGLLTPAPTIQEIDDAYRERAKVHHPDRGGDIEIFKKLGQYREQARAWVHGTHRKEHEYVICCDRFNEARLNLAAICMALRALRQLDRVGVSSILERTFKGFKVALPAHSPSKEAANVVATAS